MPPPTLVPPGGYGQPLADLPSPDAPPLAEATSEYYHPQYERIRRLLENFPVLVIYSDYTGTGKSHVVRQAAEQLVLGRQLITVPFVLTAMGLHPSLEYAYRNGGVVLLTDTTPERIVEGVRLASTILAGNPIINLHDSARPTEPHADFRLVIEYNDEEAIRKYCERTGGDIKNPALLALSIRFFDDSLTGGLYEKLLLRALPAAGVRKSFFEIRKLAPKEWVSSLHLLKFFAEMPSPTEQADLLESMFNRFCGAGACNDIKPYLAKMRGEKAEPKPARPRARYEAGAGEQDSPDEQAQALHRAVSQEQQLPPVPVATPTVVASPDPVADVTHMHQIDPALGF